MRATRAYIAGFGTAGSLVACAALVFVTASAVVAFRGWPQVASTSAPAALVVSRPHLSGPSRAEKRLVAAERATPAGGSQVAARGRTAASDAPQGSAGTAQRVTRIASVGSTPLRPKHVAAVPVSPPSSSPGAGCTANCAPASPTAGVSSTVQNTTGVIATGVTGAGQSLGPTISGVVGAVASKLSGISPALGSTVNQVGNSLGNTVTQATSVAGGLVSGAGKVLGTLLGGHH